MAKVYDNANDLITFARSSGGTSLRRVSYGDDISVPLDQWIKIGDAATTLTYNAGDGSLEVNAATTLDGAIATLPGLEAGKVYIFEANFTLGTSGDFRLTVGPSYTNMVSRQASGTVQLVFTAQNSGVRIDSYTGTGTFTINSVSVKEVFLDRATDPLVEFNHPDDMPRIDFDTNGVAKGLLIEEQRTNLLHSTDNPPSQATDVSAGSHTLSFTAGPSTSSIDQTLDNVNASDVFVYDTKNDTDGGAWRTGSRAQASSWYNETLNTNVRGSRREFPEVAVIVVEAGGPVVTIYDGDDPNLPMWMVANVRGEDTTNYGFTALGGQTGFLDSAAALNGKLCFGGSGGYSSQGLLVWDFLADTFGNYSSNGDYSGITAGTLADRNTIQLVTQSLPLIVDAVVNDVAMTVLPNAPIDPDTGLPVPTIAVATDGGVSVIKDDGTVVDITDSNGAEHVGLDPAQGLIAATFNVNFFPPDHLNIYAIPSSSHTRTDNILFNYATSPFTIPQTSKTIIANGGFPGGFVMTDDHIYGAQTSTPGQNLSMISRHDDQPQQLGCIIDTKFNTGWLPGDIKMAALADTTAETLGDAVSGATVSDPNGDGVYDGEHVTNGDFATDISGWTDASNAGGAIAWNASGHLDLIYTSGTVRAEQSISLTNGKVYAIEFEVIAAPSSSGLYIGGSSVANFVALGVGTHTVYYTATATGSVALQARVFAAGTVTIDNISVRLADPDRSVNGKSLGVHGNIIKAPVATGADLVGYSGFTNTTSYLEQPYNADLDFGTAGDFCVMGWGNSDGSVSRTFVARGDTSVKWQIQHDSTGLLRGFIGSDIVSYAGINDGNWHHIAMVRSSGTQYLYVDGVQVDSNSNNTVDLTTAGATVLFGVRHGNINTLGDGKIALWRISATVPTAEQIAKIYEDEKLLFQPNAKATLDGTSDAVTALAHDPETDLLHVGTNQSRSVFYGLRRINQTGTAVTTAISAVDGLISEQ